MSSIERDRHGREMTYSHWHREESTKRWLSPFQASYLGMIDIDDVEWCKSCKKVLALIETTRYGGVYNKQDTITSNLASEAGIACYVVYYEAETPSVCPCCDRYLPPWPDPHAFHVVGPRPARDVALMSPQEYAEWLLDLRLSHRDDCELGWGREWRALRRTA